MADRGGHVRLGRCQVKLPAAPPPRPAAPASPPPVRLGWRGRFYNTGMNARRIVNYLWTSPNTIPGLLLAVPTLLTGGKAASVDGVLEIQGGLGSWFLRHCIPLKGGAAAITLGHVVLAIDQPTLNRTRTHERVHVRQAERWGPIFFPAYAVASLIAWWRGRHYYRDNYFEREAYDLERQAGADDGRQIIEKS